MARPLIQSPTDWQAWRGLLVAGEETLAPRMTSVPVRLPFPVALRQGSIYENQRVLEHGYFTAAVAANQ